MYEGAELDAVGVTSLVYGARESSIVVGCADGAFDEFVCVAGELVGYI